MAEQNFKNHSRYIPLYHFITPAAIGFIIVNAILNLIHTCRNNHDGLGSAIAGCLTGIVLGIVWFYCRGFALKAQDRAIRAEENLRHFAIAGSLLDNRLTMRQIIALRFASNDEFVALSHRAAAENLKPAEIKKAIQYWKADNDRA
jgi:hypothetical protein